jgi:hypothetical protein
MSTTTVEVSYDHIEQRRLCHPARFRRWREDRDPRSCTFRRCDPAAVGRTGWNRSRSGCATTASATSAWHVIVSTPVTWAEVRAGGSLRFAPAQVLGRIARHGDLAQALLRVVQALH